MAKIGVVLEGKVQYVASLEEVGANNLLMVLNKFSNRHVNEDSDSPQIVKIKNMEDFFKSYGDETSGSFVFDVEFDDGTSEKIEIKNMAGFDIDTITKKTEFKKEYENREKMISEVQKSASKKKEIEQIKTNKDEIISKLDELIDLI
jgi:hypothetical protein